MPDAISFEQARECVLREIRAALPSLDTETVLTLAASGRVLAESIQADRDYPPFERSVRDGFAVRSIDLPGTLRVAGEVRAGQVYAGSVQPGQAVEIMTGAPLPSGSDQVVMVEFTRREGDAVHIDRPAKAGDNFVPVGAEAAHGAALLAPGRRLGFVDIAMLATVGRDSVSVYRQPQVAVVPTGDELVDVDQTPAPSQIRNSNAWALAAQVARAGGVPRIIGIARDNYESTRAMIEQGLQSDLLLLSGGVSLGKYDIVEDVLAEFGARFFFDRVKLQPGQPVVFGKARGKFFFGLPGNPASTMVTFETLARAAVELLAGETTPMLPLLRAHLTKDFHQKPGLTRFLPAVLSPDGQKVTPEPTQGSGDVPALARSNAFLVTDPDRETWAAGEDIRVLPISR